MYPQEHPACARNIGVVGLFGGLRIGHTLDMYNSLIYPVLPRMESFYPPDLPQKGWKAYSLRDFCNFISLRTQHAMIRWHNKLSTC